MKLSILLFSLAVLMSACNSQTNDEDSNSQSSSLQEETSYNGGYSDISGQQNFDLADNEVTIEDEEDDEGETNIEEGQSRIPSSITVSDLDGNTIHYTIDQFGNAMGYDNDGNYYHYHTDDFGNTSGYDSNGNFYHSRTDNFGNTSGYDSNGNYYHYRTDDFGNISGYDSNGNNISAHADGLGNITITSY